MTQADATLHIGDVADRVGLSLRTVRYYEEQGLVQPEGRTTGGFRLYTQAQVDRLLAIKQMKPLGFTLEEMRELLDARTVLSDAHGSDEQRTAARKRLTELADHAEVRCDKLRRSAAAGDDLVAELRAQTGLASSRLRPTSAGHRRRCNRGAPAVRQIRGCWRRRRWRRLGSGRAAKR